jgi:hypothetical protein
MDRLPLRREAIAAPAAPEKVSIGRRDNTLFRWALRLAPQCADLDALVAELREINLDFQPPFPDTVVISKARSAWNYETSGRNWVGRQARVPITRDELLAFKEEPAAHFLFNLLRVSHPSLGEQFAISQPEVSELLGWNRRTLDARIGTLIAMKRLKRVHRGLGRVRRGRVIVGDPHLYELVQ